MPLVKQSLLLEGRVEPEKRVGLGVEDLLRQLWVMVEIDLSRGVIRVPSHDSIKPHNGVRFENELFPLFVGIFWV